MNFSLLICFVIAIGYSQFRAYFESQTSLEPVVEELKLQVSRERLRLELSQEDQLHFQNKVAVLLPQVAPDLEKASYPVRQLASVVVQRDGSLHGEDRAESLLKRSKELFLAEDFEQAIPALQSYVDEYGYRSEVVEVHLLLVESLFQQGRSDEGALVVARMMEFFPSNELTAFAMLRMGKAFAADQRVEAALDLYQRVLRHFAQPEVQATARSFLAELDL